MKRPSYIRKDGKLVGKKLPKAQVGIKPTYSDSLAQYQNAMLLKNYYDKLAKNYNITIDPNINKTIPSSTGQRSIIKDIESGKIEKEHLKSPEVTEANKRIIKSKKSPDVQYMSDIITGAIDPNAPLLRYNRNIKPQGFIQYERKNPLAVYFFNKNYDINPYEFTGLTNYLKIADYNKRNPNDKTKYNTLLKNLKPVYEKFVKRYNPNISELEKIGAEQHDIIQATPGVNTTIPYYDPIAVKPWADMSPEEKKARVEKYGVIGSPLKTKEELDTIKDTGALSKKKLSANTKNWSSDTGMRYQDWANRKGYTEKRSKENPLLRELYDPSGNKVGFWEDTKWGVPNIQLLTSASNKKGGAIPKHQITGQSTYVRPSAKEIGIIKEMQKQEKKRAKEQEIADLQEMMPALKTKKQAEQFLKMKDKEAKRGPDQLRQTPKAQGKLAKLVDVAANPALALDIYRTSGTLPDYFADKPIEGVTGIGDIPYMFTGPGLVATGAKAAKDIPSELAEGNYLGAGLDASMLIPGAKAAAKIAKSPAGRLAKKAVRNLKQEAIYNALDPVGYGVTKKIISAPKTLYKNITNPSERAIRVGNQLDAKAFDPQYKDYYNTIGQNRLDAWRRGLGLRQKYGTFENVGDKARIKDFEPSPLKLSALYNDILANKFSQSSSLYTGENPLIELTKRHERLGPKIKTPYGEYSVNEMKRYLSKDKQVYEPWVQERAVEAAKNPDFKYSIYDADNATGIMGGYRWDVKKTPEGLLHFQSNDTWDLHPWKERGNIKVTPDQLDKKINEQYAKKGPLKNIEFLQLMGGKPYDIQNNFLVDPKTFKIIKKWKHGGTISYKKKDGSVVSMMKRGGQFPKYQTDGEYNMERALELGYQPNEEGHWPSVDYETGEYLKSKKHDTAWKEYLYGYIFNPEQALNYNVVVNPEGYFGEDQLQYVPKKAKGGPIVTTEGFKMGPPPQGSYYRIPSDTLYNPTDYFIEAIADTGERKVLKPKTGTTKFKGAKYVDEHRMKKGGSINKILYLSKSGKVISR